MYSPIRFKIISILTLSILSSIAAADELLPFDFDRLQAKQCSKRCTPGEVKRRTVRIYDAVCVLESVCNSDCTPYTEHHEHGTTTFDAQWGPWAQKCDADGTPIIKEDDNL